MKSAKYLVVDTNAVVKGIQLRYIGDELFTIPDVVAEIRDKQSREAFDAIQMVSDLTVRIPSAASIKQVAEFTRKTGDYASLSVPDIRVLALTLDLEKEVTGGSHLRSEPLEIVTQAGGTRTNNNQLGTDEGWFTPKEGDVEESAEGDVVEEMAGKVEQMIIEETPEDTTVEDDGWITPSNIKKKNRSLMAKEAPVEVEEKSVQVACMTGDFAMQNVLLQMGLNLLSVDGMRVKQLKNWVLRCHACYNVTRNMEKKFCDKCGGPTLIRTSMTIDPETGRMTLYLKKNFQYRIRGTQYTIPDPKGGREDNLIFREDQKEFQRAVFKERKAKEKLTKLEEEMDGYEFGVLKRMEVPSVKIGYGKNPNVVRRSRNK